MVWILFDWRLWKGQWEEKVTCLFHHSTLFMDAPYHFLLSTPNAIHLWRKAVLPFQLTDLRYLMRVHAWNEWTNKISTPSTCRITPPHTECKRPQYHRSYSLLPLTKSTNDSSLQRIATTPPISTNFKSNNGYNTIENKSCTQKRETASIPSWIQSNAECAEIAHSGNSSSCITRNGSHWE